MAELTGCSMDWISFGLGPKIRVDYSTRSEQHPGRVASPESPYGPQGLSERDSAGDLQQNREGFGFGAAVEMLARIYDSKDRFLISAVSANIKLICEAIDIRQREQRTTNEMEELKKRLIAIEKQIPPE